MSGSQQHRPHGFSVRWSSSRRSIEPLTDPWRIPQIAFHVVYVPLYRATDSATSRRWPGWGVDRIAAAWAALMARLGYGPVRRWHRRGLGCRGDRGAGRASIPTHCGSRDPSPTWWSPSARPVQPGNLTPHEQASLDAYAEHRRWGTSGATRPSNPTWPQTVGYGLADSPPRQAAWIIEKFWAWDRLRRQYPMERPQPGRDARRRHALLAAQRWRAVGLRLYWESFNRPRPDRIIGPHGRFHLFPKADLPTFPPVGRADL